MTKWKIIKKVAMWLTALAYISALIVSIRWYSTGENCLEPVVVFLALTAAGIGAFSRFKISPAIERCTHLLALMYELHANLGIVVDNYQSIPTDPLDLARLPQFELITGPFCISRLVIDPKDEEDLFQKLDQFCNLASEINIMLGFDENRAQNRQPEENRQVYVRMTTGPLMTNLRKCIKELADILQQPKYVKQHEVTKGTVMFPTLVTDD
ncbi:MAG: hypothetical protein IIA11_05765 [Proteobacteria bacterium]|nr:hypothetical protein [Pseudomonadota bacterium]